MVTDPCVRITEFTDPGCPWAYNAEPFRHRIDWLYEGRIEWEPRMVVLATTAAEQEERGFTTQMLNDALAQISADHGMPIDTRPRAYVPGSGAACRAVLATRMNATPAATRALLRNLRIRYFAGQMLDEESTILDAAVDAGVAEELPGWLGDPAVDDELTADMDAARQPIPAARALDHKLAHWTGGRRYTCPSYEITRLDDGVTIAVPVFQPFPVYDTVLANLVPGLERREPPESVAEVLGWRGIPLATEEVAVVCNVPFHDARQHLGRIATQEYVGADGFWRLDGGA